jgi:hypothetical protein
MTDPRLAAQERAHALLASGGDVIHQLGRRAGAQTASALAELDRISLTSSELMAASVRLVPLISSFKRSPGRRKWWHWFTGELLEQEVFFAATQQEIQALAARGEQARIHLLEMIDALESQRALMSKELTLLEIDIAAGQLMLTPGHAQACRQAGLDAEALSRLSRRIANLEASAVATRLTQAQYKVAVTHAHTVVDRFAEIYTLLLPIWEQAMGFELFARRLAAHKP